jgi:hypothetical protein
MSLVNCLVLEVYILILIYVIVFLSNIIYVSPVSDRIVSRIAKFSCFSRCSMFTVVIDLMELRSRGALCYRWFVVVDVVGARAWRRLCGSSKKGFVKRCSSSK